MILLALLLGVLPAGAQLESSSYEARPGLLRLSGLAVFFGVQGTLSYAATPGGLPRGAQPLGEVRGQACQQGLSVPLGLGLRAQRLRVGAGKGGYERALDDIRGRRPELRGVYDVKVDDHIVSVLGVFQRLCTEITARGFR